MKNMLMQLFMLQVFSVMDGSFRESKDKSCGTMMHPFDYMRRELGLSQSEYRQELEDLKATEIATGDGEWHLDNYEKHVRNSGTNWQQRNPNSGLWWLVHAIWEFMQGVMSVEEIDNLDPSTMEGLFKRQSPCSGKKIWIRPKDMDRYAFNRFLHLIGNHYGISSEDMKADVLAFAWDSNLSDADNAAAFFSYLEAKVAGRYGQPIYNNWWEGVIWQITSHIQTLYIDYLEGYEGYDYDGGGFNPG